MNNFDDIFTKDEIILLAKYIQHEPPVPPEMPLKLMKERRKVFFLVIERDVGKVAIVDGDKKEIVAHIPTGYAVHVLKTVEHHKTLKPKDEPGRFWYIMGRDGTVAETGEDEGGAGPDCL